MPWHQRHKMLGRRDESFITQIGRVFGNKGPKREYLESLGTKRKEKLAEDIEVVLDSWQKKIEQKEEIIENKLQGHGVARRTIGAQKTLIGIFRKLNDVQALSKRLPHIYEITAVIVHKLGLNDPEISKMLNFLYNNRKNSFHGLSPGQLPLGKLFDGNAGNLAISFARGLPKEVFSMLRQKREENYPILSTVEIIRRLNEVGLKGDDRLTHETLQFLEYLELVKRQPRKFVEGEKNPSICWTLNTREQQPIDYPNTTLSILQRITELIRGSKEAGAIEIPATELYSEMLIADRQGVIRKAGSEEGSHTKNAVIRSILPRLKERGLLDFKKKREGKAVRWVVTLTPEQRQTIVNWLEDYNMRNKVPSEELLSVLHIF